MMRRASFAAWSLAACAAGFSMSAGDVGAERRSLEARFGKKKPADPTKTMDWLKSKGLVGEAASGRAVGAVVDESGAVAEVVEKAHVPDDELLHIWKKPSGSGESHKTN